MQGRLPMLMHDLFIVANLVYFGIVLKDNKVSVYEYRKVLKLFYVQKCRIVDQPVDVDVEFYIYNLMQNEECKWFTLEDMKVALSETHSLLGPEPVELVTAIANSNIKGLYHIMVRNLILNLILSVFLYLLYLLLFMYIPFVSKNPP